MTSDELNAAAGQVNDESSSSASSSQDSETQTAKPSAAETTNLSQFVPLLIKLQAVQRYLPSPPTFVPQTFQDQIQFVFDGTSTWLYFYANSQWNALEVSTSDYGDGSDGSVTLDGSTSFGFASLGSNIYTLNRDIFCSDLTIQTGVTLKPNRFKVYSQTPINISGTVSVKGGSGSRGTDGVSALGDGTIGTGGPGGTKGAGIPSGSIKQPGDGKDGKAGLAGGGAGSPNTANGNDGVAEPNCILPNSAANGGNSGKGLINGSTGFTDNSSTGGVGGTATRITKPSAIDIVRNLVNALGAIGCNPTSGSGAGGGGGLGIAPSTDARAGGGGGGGSGAPGGIAWLCAPAINVLSGGVLIADGGDGGRGGDGGLATGLHQTYPGGGGGGGAPGNGGLIILITPSYNNQGTVTANSGTAGAGGTSTGATNGSSAGSGHNGQIVQIVP